MKNKNIPEYNFDFLGIPEKTALDLPGFRLARCCDNCLYFVKRDNSTIIGFCKRMDPIFSRHKLRRRRGSIDLPMHTDEVSSMWVKTHRTCSCSYHEYIPIQSTHRIKRICKWIEKQLTGEGEVDYLAQLQADNSII